MAIYLCQEMGNGKLVDLAAFFALGHPNSASYVSSRFRAEIKVNKAWAKETEQVCQYIIDNVT